MIREATAADQDQVLALVRHFLESTDYGEILGIRAGETPEGAAGLFDYALAHGVIYVSQHGDDLQGFLAVALVIHPLSLTSEGAELAWWVEQACRNGTIGPKLLWCAEQWVRQKGVSVLKMVAPAGSDVGRFLTRMGYQAVETVYQKGL